MSFEQMAQTMLHEYNSDSRQMQVKDRLETLRLKSYMNENGISDVSEGLSKLVEHIEEFSPQCHVDFRSDTHKINYLRKAVAEYKEWSQSPIQRITSGKFTFNGFVTALDEAIQNLKEIDLISGRSTDLKYTGHIDSDDTFISRYAHHPKFVQKRPFRNSHQLPRKRYGDHSQRSF